MGDSGAGLATEFRRKADVVWGRYWSAKAGEADEMRKLAVLTVLAALAPALISALVVTALAASL